MLVGEIFARMSLDSRQYEKDLNRLEGVTQKKALTLGSIFKGAFSFALGMGLVSGFRSLGGAITDFVNTAARTEVLGVAMQSVARSSGYVISAIEQQKKAVMDLGIAEQEAMQILTRFMQAQLDTADAAKIARTAQDAAVIAGTNSSEAALTMTEAIAKLRPELLANYGMTRNLNDIYDDFAKTVGKKVNQLSEAEKKQAILNYILKEGEKIAGTYEASMGAVGKQIGSLPRYWDTLKNAIAKPLALPAISVIVDGITNALKNAISWAEVNQLTLQRWGQTAANVAGYIIRAFRYVGQIFAQNWALIRFVGIALLTYATATKIAAGATAVFQAVSLALKGQLTTKIPILSWVSTAMGIYKMQMALAAQQGIVLTGVTAKLKVALYSLWTALGPIGWAILGISLAVAGGMALWNKYTQSVNKAWEASMADKMKAQQEKLKESIKGATGATEEQADALNKAGKATGKNLQSFDEVHQLQEEMAGEEFDLGFGEDEELFDPAAWDTDGLFDFDLEGPKATLAGFWEWIKQGASNLWESVKQKWSEFVNWVKSWDVWDWLGQKWESLKNLANTTWTGIADVASTAWNGVVNVTQTIWQEIWNLLQAYWSNTAQLATDVFGAIWGFIKGTWDNIKTTASDIWGAIWGFLSNQWNAIKELGSSIFGTLRDLILGKIDLRTAVSQIWNAIKTFFSNTWTNIKNLGIGIWTALSNFFGTQWELIKTLASTIWTAIKEFFVGNWEATKEAVINIWTAIKTFLSDTWEAVKTAATSIWTAILDFLGINWEDTKQKAIETWNNIKTAIVNKWDELKASASEAWNNIKTTISKKWEEIKNDAFSWGKNIIDSFINGIKEKFEAIKTTISNIGETIRGAFSGGGGSSSGGGGGGGMPSDNKMVAERNREIQNALKVQEAIKAGKPIPKLATGTNYVPQDMLAFLHEGEAVVPKAYNPAASGMSAEQLEQAIYRAFINAIRVVQASSQPAEKGDLVIKMNAREVAREVLPELTKEAQRQGMEFILRPQRV